jgi:hypothetical protein
VARDHGYRVILPRVAVEDPGMLARILARVAARLPDVLDGAAGPHNTWRDWEALDSLEVANTRPWEFGAPLPEWCNAVRLTVRRIS